MRLRFAGARDSLELRRADSPTVQARNRIVRFRVPASLSEKKTPKRDTPRRALRGRGGETRARASSRHARLRASFASRAVRLPRRDEARRAPVPLEHRPADGSSSPVPELDGSGSLSRTGSRARRTDESALPVPSSATGVTREVFIVGHVASARPHASAAGARAGTTRFAPDSHEETFSGPRMADDDAPASDRAPRPSAARADGHAVRGRAGAEDGRAERPRPDAVGRAARPRAARHRGASNRAGPQEAGQRLPARRARFFRDAAANAGGDGDPTAAFLRGYIEPGHADSSPANPARVVRRREQDVPARAAGR